MSLAPLDLDTMYLPSIVGLTGYKRHGKDTVGQILVKDYGYARVSYAAALKAMALRIDPIIGVDALGYQVRLSKEWRRHDGDENVIKELHPEYVRFLQRLGTDGIRSVDDGFWVRQAVAAIRDLQGGGRNVVITDVRFPNEAEALRLLAPDTELWNVAAVARLGAPDLEHESERHAGHMGEDVFIDNNGTQGDLLRIVTNLLEGR